MKKIIHTLLIVLSVAVCSCNDNLDLLPVGSLTDSNFPATDGDGIALVNAIYQPNVGISTSLGYLIDLTTELEANGENTNSGGYLLGVMQWEPNNSYVTGMWNSLYNGITRANDVVDKVGASESISPDLKRRLVGEAKFLRAYYYFYAVQFWGEVPLVLHNTEGSNTTRTAVDDVYGQIVQDLKDAAAALPRADEYADADRGRATQGAAYAYLAKVYLVWGQTSEKSGAAVQKERYRESLNYSAQVTGYELEENFLDNWSKINRNGKESIFATQHIQGQAAASDGGNHLVHCSFYGGFSNSRLPHVYATSDYWYHDFDDRDQRKKGTYVKELFDPSTGEVFVFDRVRFRKYIDTTDVISSANTRDINRTIIRYAEVLLLRAEALNEFNGGPTDEAYVAINQVRRRAFRQFPLTAVPAEPGVDLPPGLDYAGFRQRIQQERVFELTYEQNRWTDLVRWRTFVGTLRNAVKQGYLSEEYNKQNVKLKYYRFPIPKGQRDINPDGLWQNWGYDGFDESKTGANPYAAFEPEYAGEGF
ncbi:MAG: RagB/SusD family nutrient uptake outer membrane protein [Tannerella sp.]|nr:RagB/SusD family nutrient uptake outer membrane protein [Tannerella sp.]